jgi:hypothetical protein
MTKLVSLALALAPLLFVSNALAQSAACTYPQAPQALPIGTQATEAEMKAANTTVKEYRNSVEQVFLPCIDKETETAISALDSTAPDYEAKKAMLVNIQAKRHNAAVEELQALATRWNAEIKAFKEKAAK